MQSVPGHATAYGRKITQEPERHSGAEHDLLIPAERIALTIGLLNRGLDLVNEFARTSLVGCARVAFRAQHDGERQRRPCRII